MSIEIKNRPSRPRILLALASLLIAALILFLLLPRNRGPYRALPSQTSLMLECKGLLRAKILTDKTPDPQWHEVLHSTLFKNCFEDATAALQLFKHDPEVFRAFAKNKALAAFSLHPADSLHALFAVELDETFDLEKLLKTNKLTPKYFPHQFHGNNIYNVHLTKTERLEVAVSGRLLLFSRKATLVEDALAQLENTDNWWTDRPYITDLPDAPLHLQIRPAALAEQYRNQMHQRWRGLPDLLARNVEWVGLSWDGKNLSAMAETNGFLSSLRTWGKVPGNAIFAVLPDNTAFLARAGIGHCPKFFREIGEGRSGDFEQFVLPWVGAEAALVITQPLSPALLGDRLLLLAVRDSAQAITSLQAFGKERGTIPDMTGAYQMFELLAFQNSSLLKPILGDDEAFRNPVCALVGGYAVFAPDRSSLEIFLDKYLVNQTLAAHTDFLQLQHKRSEAGQISLLLNTAYLPGILQNIVENADAGSLARTGFISAELKANFNRKINVSLASQGMSQALPETDILWKTMLASPGATQPYLVEQPEAKTFALVQDIKSTLYCLDVMNGAVQWSKPLPDRILSDIRGVDFYGNGTNCYTFSSATRIYTLDDNGRDVEGFPFQLPAPATNAVTVVDFDKNTKLNYFVACSNGQIYGFAHLGKPLDGWNSLPVAGGTAGVKGVVSQPILHFQHKGKDYLAVLTESGLLSVFGRDGTLRFKPVQLDGVFNSPMKVDAASISPRIYCANTEGKIFACDLLGKVSSLQVGKSGSVVAFGQLTGDARFEWAVLEGKNLTVGGWETAGGNQIFKNQFRENQHIIFFTKNNHIGTVDKLGRRVWLIDSKGKIASGFPLGGNTAFEFCRLNNVNMLVTGNGNGVWAYRVRF